MIGSRLLLSAALVLVLVWRASPAVAREAPFSPQELDEIGRYVEENPDFGRVFTREWEKVLGRLESTREHREFVLRRRQVELVITDTGHDIKPRTAARFARGSVLLNRTYLVSQAVQLQSRGLPPDEAAEVLAWKTMPILAHEIRHGILEEAMRRGLGVECGAGVLEEELLAFYDNARVFQEAVGLRPELFEESMLLDIDAQNGTILARWNKGAAELAELVRDTYPGKIELRTASRKDFLRALNKDQADLRKISAETARQEKILRTSTEPGAREAAQAYLDSPPSLAESRELLRKSEACSRAVTSAGAFEALRGFYAARVAAARR